MTKLQRQIFKETLSSLTYQANSWEWHNRPQFICSQFPNAYLAVTKAKFVDWEIVDSCKDILHDVFNDNPFSTVIFRITKFDTVTESNNARLLALHFLLTCPKNFL